MPASEHQLPHHLIESKCARTSLRSREVTPGNRLRTIQGTKQCSTNKSIQLKMSSSNHCWEEACNYCAIVL